MRRSLPALASGHQGPSVRTRSVAQHCALALTLVAFVVAVTPRPRWVAVDPAPVGAPGRARSVAPLSVLVARARSEPALALDPRDSRHIVVVANPDYFGVLANEPINGTFVSSDGGATWEQGTAPTYGRFTGVADPSVGFDAAGRAYYLWMGETPAWCGQTGNTALLLARSLDGGRTFVPPTVVDVNPADDKPYLAVSAQGGHTAIYASFTRWLNAGPQILFTRSLDGGRTFTPPTVLFASPGVNFASLPIVGAHGHLYVVWAHYHSSSYYGPLQASIMLGASVDGGRTFGSPVIVAAFTGLPEMIVPGSVRDFTLPAAGVNVRTGALYVAWVRARAMPHPRYAGEMDADLVLSRSRDGGRTWTRPVVLNDTLLGDRFVPALTIGAGGVVRVSFYDRRTDHVRFGLYGVAVRDLGTRLRIWPNRQISPTLSSPYTLHYIVPNSTCVAPGRYVGDYIAAATAPDGTLDTMWTDTALGTPKETDLWFARVPPGYLQAGTPRVARW